MAAYGIPVLFGLWTFGGVGFACFVGLRALRAARAFAGERHVALRMVALNMLEPAVNAALIPLLVALALSLSGAGDSLFAWLAPLAIAGPAMAVLFLPRRGMASPDQLCADTCRQLLVIGWCRWVWTMLTFGLVFLGPLLMLGGMALLWVSAVWCNRQITLIEYAGPGPEAAQLGSA